MQEESRAGNRLINTNFLKSLTRLTNRALLLYYSFITWADSMGAVGEAEVILTLLQAKADNEGDTGVGLVKTDYRSALDELVEKGLIYEVKLTGGNAVYIIKHWWLHNKWRKYLKSNFYKAINQFYIEAGEYRPKNERKKSRTKESEEEQVTKTKTKTKTNSNSNELQTSQEECVGTHEEPLCNEEETDMTELYFDLQLLSHGRLSNEEFENLYKEIVEMGADEDNGLDDRFREIAKTKISKLEAEKSKGD
jgi:hypothetical protein